MDEHQICNAIKIDAQNPIKYLFSMIILHHFLLICYNTFELQQFAKGVTYMLSIQLNPQLHHVIHRLKSVDLRENEISFFSALSLSKEEVTAMTRTFVSPANTRQKEVAEPACSWV
ncbi:hypothetical protein HQN89_21585 [Paenibacillus frigoriresistens]|uniref:hypothetical protein n=1 Tax=Paenibacillus alginolyticus TaxID=59839 RepID=UPI001565E309|nr:hypothetical protein [Paenibacillus frigoriresistens]NRF93541.1 hypothetical protein [Paenibacillus frigoriresistens]